LKSKELISLGNQGRIMGLTLRVLLALSLAFFISGCGSKAKQAKETQEKLAKWEAEHKAQMMKVESAPPAPKSHGEIAEGVVARVNNEVIFFSDLELAGREVFDQIRAQFPPERAEAEIREARKKVLERLIDKVLLEQEAERLKVQVSEEEVESTFENLLRTRGVTKEQFYVELARQKVTPEKLKEKLKKELMVARMLEILIRSHIHVTDKECQEFYQRTYGISSSGQAPPGDAIRLQQIILLVKGDSEKEKAEKKKLMEEIRSRILKGEDFGKLARKYTQGPNPEGGGDCGLFRPGELLPELDRVAFSLKPGEVSQVIETKLGFHLLRVMSKEESTVTIPDSLKAQIRAQLEERQFQEELQKFLDNLKKNAFIEIKM
jgi:peptidyl-prolyl cis-trans isomerase SurA